MNVRPNGDWADKWKGEAVRLIVVLLISLGISYLALSRSRDDLNRGFQSNCLHIEAVAANQTKVLISLLALVDVLNDRQKVHLKAIPDRLRDQIIFALAAVPDKRSCNKPS